MHKFTHTQPGRRKKDNVIVWYSIHQNHESRGCIVYVLPLPVHEFDRWQDNRNYKKPQCNYLTCLAISKACCFCSLKYNWNYGLNCFTVNLSRKFHKVNCKLNDNYFDLTLSSLFERKKQIRKSNTSSLETCSSRIASKQNSCFSTQAIRSTFQWKEYVSRHHKSRKNRSKEVLLKSNNYSNRKNMITQSI